MQMLCHPVADIGKHINKLRQRERDVKIYESFTAVSSLKIVNARQIICELCKS